MFEDEETKKYISSINKIIRNGDPKYVSYISREYMRQKQESPMLAEVMEDMIRKEAKEAGSVYAIFIDKDNGINLDAMSDISKITNVSDFIKNVEALSDQNVDFGDLTSDELIIEGMQIAEEIANEIESSENQIDDNDQSENNIENQAEEKINVKIGKMSLMVGTSKAATVIARIRNRIRNFIVKRRERRLQRKEEQRIKEEQNKKDKEKEEKYKEEKEGQSSSEKSSDDFIPKVDINEKEVIRQMEMNKTAGKSNVLGKSAINDFDGSPDDSDDNFNNGSDDDNNNTSQEDDEPDI